MLAPSMFGNAEVYLNDDWESYTYNYVNNQALVDENGGSDSG